MIHNLVVAEGEAGWELKRALLYHCDAPAVRVLERFPGEAEWEYLLSIYGPEAVWLEAEDPELCAETARIVKRVRPEAAIIGYGHQSDHDAITYLLESGIDEYVGQPFPATVLRDCYGRVLAF